MDNKDELKIGASPYFLKVRLVPMFAPELIICSIGDNLFLKKSISQEYYLFLKFVLT